ncbi:MAG TPA: hypothetical protein PLA94_32210, partial [Myxococcota bacterium]|nr:hypothetical protein [Myxococcota bacterium]
MAYSTSDAFLWDPQWYPSTGVATVDFLADVAIIDAVGGGAGVSLKPAMQFAATRIDRPANMGSRIS